MLHRIAFIAIGFVLGAGSSAVAGRNSGEQLDPPSTQVFVAHTFELGQSGFRHNDVHTLDVCDQADLDWDGLVQIDDFNLFAQCLNHRSNIPSHPPHP